MFSFDKTVERWLERALCLLLTLLLLLACGQILLRSSADTTFLWIDPLLRYLVLWSGFTGAILASLQGKHIAIDMSSLIVSKKIQPLINFLVTLVSAATCYGLLWASWLFIVSEKEYGGLGLLGVASWLWNLVFPITFAVMSLIYTVEILLFFTSSFRKKQLHG